MFWDQRCDTALQAFEQPHNTVAIPIQDGSHEIHRVSAASTNGLGLDLACVSVSHDVVRMPRQIGEAPPIIHRQGSRREAGGWGAWRLSRPGTQQVLPFSVPFQARYSARNGWPIFVLASGRIFRDKAGEYNLYCLSPPKGNAVPTVASPCPQLLDGRDRTLASCGPALAP